ncbi:hypothetical protein JXQ70_06630 [bacterium]|nr:hypothetical protein [bacterium]
MNTERMLEIIAETKEQYDYKRFLQPDRPFMPRKNYCSSIGDPCLRFLVFQRRYGSQAKKDAGLQRILDRGTLLERHLYNELGTFGAEVAEPQFPIDFPDLNLSGKGDWMQKFSFGWAPVEMKVVSYSDRIKSVKDFMDSDQRYHRRYVYQLTAAMVAQDASVGAFLIFDPVSFDWKLLPLELDWDLWEEVVNRCREIETHLKAGSLPPAMEWHETWCMNCEYLDRCRESIPEVEYGLLTDPELQDLLERREDIRASYLEYSKIEKSLKARLPDCEGTFRAGPFEITGKRVERQSYAVEAGSYIRREIRRW